MPVQPRTPQGVLELLPAQQIAFQRMLDTIRRGFERFGFLPVETPTFELTDILLTKSGGETEKQVYFVQSTGSLESGKRPELALRFDLTVPLARYVAEHEHELNFPFRRYQIQRVYRGERPQKGRSREFYQCDIDVVGKDTLAISYDAEIPAIIHGIFAELGIGAFTIRINNRKLLRGLLETLGVREESQASVLHEVDRLGKQPRDDIEPRIAGLAGADTAKRLLDLLTQTAGNSAATLELLHGFASTHPLYAEGLAELERVYTGTLALGVPAKALVIDLSIVRGLDYYTGTVYETFLDDHRGIGSICSGGRYENLASHYTKSKLPGVGISIGATRLFAQLVELGLYGAAARSTAQVIILNVDPALAGDYARLAGELRADAINTEVYGGDDKLGKQFKYADRGGIPLAVVIGSRERDAGTAKLKDLRVTDTAVVNEREVPRLELIGTVRELLGRG
jgi:histidyl-tRNA synthetase